MRTLAAPRLRYLHLTGDSLCEVRREFQELLSLFVLSRTERNIYNQLRWVKRKKRNLCTRRILRNDSGGVSIESGTVWSGQEHDGTIWSIEGCLGKAIFVTACHEVPEQQQQNIMDEVTFNSALAGNHAPRRFDATKCQDS